MKKNSYYLNIIAAILCLLATAISCNDYLDVNTDTDNPTEAPLNFLLTNSQRDLAKVGNFGENSATIVQVYTHQITVREDADQYGTKANDAALENEWSSIYLTITDLETLIEQGTKTENLVYVGIAQLQKAYLLSVAVDLWGEVPFTESNQLINGIVAPKFDSQETVYAGVFGLIKAGKENILSKKGLLKPANDDLFYNGNTEKWIRFANTLQLKLYNQIRLSATFNQTELDKLISENNFFNSINDDFQLVHTKATSPSDERNLFFLDSYTSTQFTTHMSPWFYEILMGMNPTIFTNNKDPRIPYYFYNQLVAEELPIDNGDAATGNPKADYWDASSGFFSIRFGSQGPWKDFSTEKSYTYPGIFVCGGRFDDKKGGNVDDMMSEKAGAKEKPTGIAPYRILTYDAFLYTQAELILAGKITGNPAEKLKEALVASFQKVDAVVAKNESKQINIPTLSGATAVENFIEKIIEEFEAASPTKKLEIIITQKWVASFGSPLDQYNDYRRTGFPILANPNSSSKEYQLDNQDGFPIVDSETKLNNPFPLSLYWPSVEINTNKNAPKQKNVATYAIFWDTNAN